jgi:ABC-type transport system involved in multi-copper enzyme maturation permease subunit
MWAIAINTLKEFLRNKILYVIIGLAIVLILFSIVLVQLTITETKKVFIDTALTVIEVFALITTLFLGSYLLYNEIQKNTILLILSKNPSRASFIIGKYLGFSLLVFFIYIVFAIAFVLTGLILKYKLGVNIDL